MYSTNKKVDDSVLEYMSKVSTGFSGAELENFINQCALTQIIKEKDEIDLDVAENTFFKMVTQGSKITSNKKLKEENEITAWHEAGHALASKLYGEEVMQVTISGSSSGVGGFTLNTDLDNHLPKLSDLENKVKVFYAGRIAESFLLGDDITVGAQNDIEKATEIIKSMVIRFGMNDTRTMLNLNIIKDEEFIIEEARAISDKLYNEVFDDLKSNERVLEEIANTLLEEETLYNDDIEDILNKYDNKEDLEAVAY